MGMIQEVEETSTVRKLHLEDGTGSMVITLYVDEAENELQASHKESAAHA
jgi:hypothetical protein